MGAPVLVDVGAGKGAVVVVGVFPGLVVDAPLLRVGEDGVDAGEELGAGRRSLIHVYYVICSNFYVCMLKPSKRETRMYSISRS